MSTPLSIAFLINFKQSLGHNVFQMEFIKIAEKLTIIFIAQNVDFTLQNYDKDRKTC